MEAIRGMMEVLLATLILVPVGACVAVAVPLRWPMWRIIATVLATLAIYWILLLALATRIVALHPGFECPSCGEVFQVEDLEKVPCGAVDRRAPRRIFSADYFYQPLVGKGSKDPRRVDAAYRFEFGPGERLFVGDYGKRFHGRARYALNARLKEAS